MKDVNEWTREEFLALPTIPWSKEPKCKGIIFIPDATETLHDSGYRFIEIVLLDNKMNPFGRRGGNADHIRLETMAGGPVAGFNIDCLKVSQCLRLWSWSHDVTLSVSAALSSVWIKEIKQ